MNIQEVLLQMKSQWETIEQETVKPAKAAHRRARIASTKLAKLMKEYRKLSNDLDNK
jgi:hypothetical protein